MILSLAVAVWIGASQAQTQSAFVRLFPHASGRNGLEEYVKAGDLLRDPAFRVYQSWQPPDKRPTPEQRRQEEEARKKLLASMSPEERKGAEAESTHLNAEDQVLADRVANLNYFELKKLEVQQFQEALDLLAAGNGKPFKYQFEVGSDAEDQNFDVQASFRSVARLASDAAFVAFADGQASRGTDYLLQCLEMGHRVSSGGVLSEIVGSGITSVALNRLSEHLGAIPLADAQRIEKESIKLLEDRSLLEAIIKNERVHDVELLRASLKAELDKKPTNGEQDLVAKQYDSLNPDQRQAFFEHVLSLLDQRFSGALERFNSPEENWLVRKDEGDKEPKDPQTLEELAGSLAQLFSMPTSHDFMLNLLRSRTQLRLLRLHARIIEFRYEAGRLPNSLSELKLAPEDNYDPLSRKPFQYSSSFGTYKLSSAGIPETGEIELRYRAPKNPNASDPDRP